MEIFFYIFSFTMILGAIGVVTSSNPVYSVLWLIFTFLNSSAIFILLGAEFIAMSVIILYVGAVAVLFLFVVMMLHVKEPSFKESLLSNRLVSAGLMSLLIMDLYFIVSSSFSGGYSILLSKPYPQKTFNTHAIGEILYTDFIVPFQVSGLILLVAMVGCISLTLRKREGVKSQEHSKQLSRTIEESLEIKKVRTKEGVDGINYK